MLASEKVKYISIICDSMSEINSYLYFISFKTSRDIITHFFRNFIFLCESNIINEIKKYAHGSISL